MHYLRSFIVLYKNQVQNATEYRGMMAIWMFHAFFVPFVMLLVWVSLANHNPHLMEQRDTIIAYYLILPIVTMITGAWHAPFFANKIRNGELNVYLTKPMPYFLYDIANNLAEKTVKLLILVPMVFVGWYFYPVAIGLSVPQIAIFGLMVFLSLAIKFAYESVIAHLAFWLDDVSGLINFTDIAEHTIGGRFIPIFLFPALLQNAVVYIPFRYFIAFPAEYLSGSLTQNQVITGLTQQTIWTVIFILVAYLLWRRGMKTYGAVGG